MTAFRQFLVEDVKKACNFYIENQIEMLETIRLAKIQKLMSKKYFPKSSEAAAIQELKDKYEWEPSLEYQVKMDKINKLLKLCSIQSTETWVTLDEDYANILHLFFQK